MALKMSFGKKGIVFTILATTIALLILSLAMLAKDQETRESVAIIPSVAILDRIYNVEVSIQKGIQEIFTETSGVNVEVDPGVVVVTESLPNNLDALYISELKRFQPFVNANKSYLNFSLNKSFSPFVLESDQGFNYTQYQFGKNITLQHSDAVDSYELYFLSNESNATINWASYSAGATLVDVVVESTDGWSLSSSNSVDLDQTGSVQIGNLDGGDVMIKFRDGIINITSSSTETLVFRATVNFDTTSVPSMRFGGMLLFNFSEYGISKISDVIIG